MSTITQMENLEPWQWFTFSSTQNPNDYLAVNPALYEPNRFFLVIQKHHDYAGLNVDFVDNDGHRYSLRNGMISGCFLTPDTRLSIYNRSDMIALSGKAAVESAYINAIQGCYEGIERVREKADEPPQRYKHHQRYVESLCQRGAKTAQHLALQLEDLRGSLRIQSMKKAMTFFSREQLQHAAIPPALVDSIEALSDNPSLFMMAPFQKQKP